MLGHLDVTYYDTIFAGGAEGKTLVRTKAPQDGAYIVSLDEAKKHLRIDHNEDDATLRMYIDAAAQNIDGWDGFLGRALLTQEWEMRLDRFCYDIVIPLPPLISIDSVKYVDGEGVVQTVDEATYEVIPGGSWFSRLRSVYNASWPSIRYEGGAVRIAFTAGYGNPLQVPSGIRNAILMMVAHWYENREAVSAADLKIVPMTAAALLQPYRVL